MGERTGTNNKNMLHSILQPVIMFAIYASFQIPTDQFQQIILHLTFHQFYISKYRFER